VTRDIVEVEVHLEPIYGNTTGLKPQQSRALQALYRRRLERRQWLSPLLARALTETSRDTHRRLGLLVDRNGEIDKVVVGDAHRVFLPDLGPRRAGAARFRGLRLILSNLGPEGLTEDDLTDLALLQLDAVITVRVLDDGLPGEIQYAHLLPPEDGRDDPVWQVEPIASVHRWDDDFGAFIADLEAQFTRAPQLKRVEGRAGVILVGITLDDPKRAERSLGELGRLADTAGLQVLDRVLQRKAELDGKTCIGKGKLQELVVRSMHLEAEALIFDRELSPSQLRNIASETDLKVLDRTQLILDIFAQHATSREGKLQVELAQLRYRMPRLAIMPTAMSRLTGGIGGRGPGETKLEINKRRAQERVTRLERLLTELAQHRSTRRAKRTKAEIPIVSIVGYTNAGKSTLLNRMTQSTVVALDKLFATLDPTTRRLRFPEQREIILTDTVGFIEDLPQTLVSAFKSTLEELEEADLLLHVLDASDPAVGHHKAAVDAILTDLGLHERDTMLVWNKADLVDAERLRELIDAHGGRAISATEGDGFDELLRAIEQHLFRQARFRRHHDEHEAPAC
jgi:GTP-binding protein HflX